MQPGFSITKVTQQDWCCCSQGSVPFVRFVPSCAPDFDVRFTRHSPGWSGRSPSAYRFNGDASNETVSAMIRNNETTLQNGQPPTHSCRMTIHKCWTIARSSVPIIMTQAFIPSSNGNKPNVAFFRPQSNIRAKPLSYCSHVENARGPCQFACGFAIVKGDGRRNH